jgi:ketosteroid isomerase-like protein
MSAGKNATSKEQPQMNSEQLAQRFIEALHQLEQGSTQDVDGMVELFSDEARLINAALKLAGKEHRGRQGARQFWTEYRSTFGDASSEFFQITTSDVAAGLFWTTRGSDNTGQPIEYDGGSLLVFDGEGKIELFRGYYDTREVERQVGGG